MVLTSLLTLGLTWPGTETMGQKHLVLGKGNTFAFDLVFSSESLLRRAAKTAPSFAWSLVELCVILLQMAPEF